MSHEELIELARDQAVRIEAQDRQITALAARLAESMEANEKLAAQLARLEHLLSRNSGNSSAPPSRDDDPGKPAPPQKRSARKGGAKRARGKQAGAAGSHLAWTKHPNRQRDLFPTGCCGCGADLGPTLVERDGVFDDDQM